MASDNSPPGSRTTAGPPFDKSSADVVLCTLDDIDFLVHAQILCMASDVFESMLSIPQPNVSDPRDVHTETGLPLVHVSEDSQTLDRLLRLCYPVADPKLCSLDDIKPVLAAAVKYQMEEAIALMKDKVKSLCMDSPLPVYVVACELDLEDLAHQAAATVRVRELTTEYAPELDRITAAQYYRLLYYGARRPPSINAGLSLNSPSLTFCRSPIPDSASSDSSSVVSNFVTEFGGPHAIADMTIRSADDVEFSVHRNILAMASATLLDSRPVSTSPSTSAAVSIRVDEVASVLSILLQLIYPLPEPTISDLRTLAAVTDAAARYGMVRVIQTLKRLWAEYLDTSPLRAYLIATRHGWDKEAREAARRACCEKTDAYVPEMEAVSASAYRRFLVYRYRCREAVSRLTLPLIQPHHRQEKKPSRSKQLYWSKTGAEYSNFRDAFALDVLEMVQRAAGAGCMHAVVASLEPDMIITAAHPGEQFLTTVASLEEAVRKVLQGIEL
ncbi:uncharacterized protein C8Q71DRAFT_553598 [Rhodofomes roseus]|uniref:BTB domain-containing protein n=1 Tax=Rhodofomes roseus TaxID=34475 RepID=A0ABQ8KI29_9APHY|nr:uncharacterized protein C8Q71DRAFT_553598 [Rhodofomes roseus]KAH9837621.1 hypothetical protein C8Q71DRAFT_553598 [Rhodofomes roseus]